MSGPVLLTGHFTRVKVAGWSLGDPVPNDTTGWAGFEQRAAQAINADEGGCWAPATPIIFDSSGGGGHVRVTGPVLLSSGGTLTTESGGNARFTIRASYFPQLGATHTGRTREILTSFLRGVASPPIGVRDVLQLGGLQTIANAIQQVDPPAVWHDIFIVSPSGNAAAPVPITWQRALTTHTGGVITAVTVTYRAILGTPKARLLRVAADGSAIPLCSTAIGADADGWQSAPEADPTLTVQSWTFFVDGGSSPSNALVDRSQYSYVLEVQEDTSQIAAAISQFGSQFPYVVPLYAPVRLASTTPIDLASPPSTIDSVSVNAGDSILLTAQADPSENGLYTVPSPATDPWTTAWRADQFALGVAQGAIVRVQAGGSPVGNGGQYFQMVSPTVAPLGGQAKATQTQRWGAIPLNPLAQQGASFIPRGNVYHAAVVRHENIQDLRFQ